VLAVTAATAAIVAGREVRRAVDGSAHRIDVVLAALSGAVVAFASVLEVRSSGGAPLGYSNANGALFASLAFAVVLVRVTTEASSRGTRRATTVLTIVAATACVLTGSVGAVAAAAIGLAVGGGPAAAGRRWAAIPLAAATVVATVGLVFAVALGAGPDAPGSDSFGTRAQLWRATAELAGDHPVTGIGPGRFQEESPVSVDLDLRRAHSAPLQVAAELGLPGLALFFALGAWVVAALWMVRDEPAASVGAAAFTAVALHAGFDWVLAEPTVLVVSALVIGAATTSFEPRPAAPARDGDARERALDRQPG
jgi:O-antigen ligase